MRLRTDQQDGIAPVQDPIVITVHPGSFKALGSVHEDPESPASVRFTWLDPDELNRGQRVEKSLIVQLHRLASGSAPSMAASAGGDALFAGSAPQVSRFQHRSIDVTPGALLSSAWASEPSRGTETGEGQQPASNVTEEQLGPRQTRRFIPVVLFV